MHHVAHTLAFGLPDRARTHKTELPSGWAMLWHRLTAWRRPSTALVQRRLNAYL